jgi:hypothetical protein
VITEDDICNQLLDHWAEQNKQHLDDDEKCCYVLAVRAADEIRRLGAEVDALRADAERYRAMRREKGGMMRDIDKAIRLINDWNHDKEHATHGHAVWVGLKLIHEVEALRAENDRMRETLQGILDSDWRKWEELASPEEFVRWAKARAKHALTPHGD